MERGPSCCDAPTVNESELQDCAVKAFNLAIGDRGEMFVAPEENIAAVFALEDETSVESINAKLNELQQELLKRAN